MITSAREMDALIRKAALPPPGWHPGHWRRDVVVASGLSALGAEAALLDLGVKKPTIIRNPSLCAEIAPTGQGILGCSFSGRSAEVLDGLALLKAQGIATCLIGGNEGAGVPLPGSDSPRAWQHAAYAAALPRLLAPGFPLPIADQRSSPREFFRSVYEQQLTPIFVAADHHFICRLWRSYWIEFLGRPAFLLAHPEWSHDFFWSIVRSRGSYAFIIGQPAADLSDGRMKKIITWIERRGFPLFTLPPAPWPASAVQELLASAEDFQALAAEFDLDLSADLELSPQGEIFTS